MGVVANVDIREQRNYLIEDIQIKQDIKSIFVEFKKILRVQDGEMSNVMHFTIILNFWFGKYPHLIIKIGKPSNLSATNYHIINQEIN